MKDKISVLSSMRLEHEVEQRDSESEKLCKMFESSCNQVSIFRKKIAKGMYVLNYLDTYFWGRQSQKSHLTDSKKIVKKNCLRRTKGYTGWLKKVL